MKFDIPVANKVVALDAFGLRGFAFAVFFIGKHRLADMDTPVVDDADLPHLRSAGFENTGNTLAQYVISEMPEVEGLIGVGT
jgi:hypothetical protein